MTAPMPISKASRTCSRSASTAPCRCSPKSSRRARAAAAAARRRRSRNSATIPDGGGKITVRDGKYGPYVNYGKVNATLPKGKDPAIGDAGRGARADRREGGQGRRRQEAGPQGAAKPAAKRREEAGRKEASREASRPQEEGLDAAWRAGSPDEAHGDPRRADKRRGPRQGRLSALARRDPALSSPKIPDRSRQARHRQGLRAQGRGPHLAEGPAARPAGRGPARQRAASASTRAGALAHVTVLDIFGRDARRRPAGAPGELAEAAGKPPVVSIRAAARRQRSGARHRRPRAGQDLSDRGSGDGARLYRRGS